MEDIANLSEIPGMFLSPSPKVLIITLSANPPEKSDESLKLFPARADSFVRSGDLSMLRAVFFIGSSLPFESSSALETVTIRSVLTLEGHISAHFMQLRQSSILSAIKFSGGRSSSRSDFANCTLPLGEEDSRPLSA